MSECRNCEGAEWVCEDHQDHPWGGMSASDLACHCGGAGSPCPVCSREMACAPYISEMHLTNRALYEALEGAVSVLRSWDIYPSAGGLAKIEAVLARARGEQP